MCLRTISLWVAAGATLSTLIAFPAIALTPDQPVQIEVHGLRIPVVQLPEVRMAQGTKDEFAARVGDELRRFTRAEHAEACALLCRAPTGEWGVIPISIRAHAACPIADACPEGMVSVGEGIHSHNPKGRYVATRADIIVVGVDGVGQAWHAADPDVLSDEDKRGIPGYLVSPTSLWHFDGVHTVEVPDPAVPVSSMVGN